MGKINQIYGNSKTGKTVFGSQVLHRPGWKFKPGEKVIWNSPEHGRVVAFIAFTSVLQHSTRQLRLEEGIWDTPTSKRYAYTARVTELSEYNAIALLAGLVDHAAIEQRVLDDHAGHDGDDGCPICVALKAGLW